MTPAIKVTRVSRILYGQGYQPPTMFDGEISDEGFVMDEIGGVSANL